MMNSIEKAVLIAAGSNSATRQSVIDAGLRVTHATRHEVEKTVDNALFHGLLWEANDQLDTTRVGLTKHGKAILA